MAKGFQKGNALGGRKFGARQKLSEGFVNKLHDSWKEHGVAAIDAVAKKSPEKYLDLISRLLPRQIQAEVTHDGIVTHEHVSVSEVDSFIEGALSRKTSRDTKNIISH